MTNGDRKVNYNTLAIWSVVLGLIVAAFTLFDDLHEDYVDKKDQALKEKEHLIEHHYTKPH